MRLSGVRGAGIIVVIPRAGDARRARLRRSVRIAVPEVILYGDIAAAGGVVEIDGGFSASPAAKAEIHKRVVVHLPANAGVGVDAGYKSITVPCDAVRVAAALQEHVPVNLHIV